MFQGHQGKPGAEVAVGQGGSGHGRLAIPLIGFGIPLVVEVLVPIADVLPTRRRRRRVRGPPGRRLIVVRGPVPPPGRAAGARGWAAVVRSDKLLHGPGSVPRRRSEDGRQITRNVAVASVTAVVAVRRVARRSVVRIARGGGRRDVPGRQARAWRRVIVWRRTKARRVERVLRVILPTKAGPGEDLGPARRGPQPQKNAA